MGDRRPRSPMRDRNRARQDQPRNPGYDQRGGFRRDNRRDDEPPRRDDRRQERDYRRRSRSPRRDMRDDKYAKDKDSTALTGTPRAPVAARDDGRRDRDRSRSPRRDRDRDFKRDDRRRSRSPRRERERDSRRGGRRDRDTRSRSPRRERDREPEVYKDTEKITDPARLQVREEEFAKSRTATPPVSFKVGGAAPKDESSGKAGQDHDRMEVDKPVKKGSSSKKEKAEESEDEVDIVVEDDGLAAMQAMMGFGGFGTTHQKKVPGNDISAVRKEKKTEYRQYMNRVGGFNRPLDEMP